MTELEISRALALAIGYLPEHVREYGVGSVNFEHGEGIIQVFRYDGVYGPERTDCAHLWNDFRYTSWAVISPIAERFDCFPSIGYPNSDTPWESLSVHNYELVRADTPQKAIAMAVIKQGEKQ